MSVVSHESSDQTAGAEGSAPIQAKGSRLTSNFIFSAISEGSIALLFLLLILSARFLGDERFGIFSFVMAYTGIFSFLIDGGFRHVYLRSVARDPTLTDRYLGNILSLQMIYGLVGFVLMIGLMELTDKSDQTYMAVQLMALAEVLRGMKYLFRYVFRTADQYRWEMVTVVIERVLLFVVGIGVLLTGGGVVALSAVFVGVRLFDLLLLLIIINRTVTRPSFKFQADLWLGLIKEAFPFMLNGAVALMLFKIDSVLLSLMRTDAEVGWYNATYRLIDGMFIIALTLSATFYPAFARAYQDVGEGQRLLARALRYIFLFAIPITLIGGVISEYLIPLIYGSEYTNSIQAFQILAFAIPLLFIHEIIVVFLASINRQKVALGAAFLALLINLSLNLLLIPDYGFIAAGIATVLAEFLLVLVAAAYLRMRGYTVPYLSLVFKPATAALLVAGFIHFWVNSLSIALFVGIIGYFGLLTLFRFWDEKEIRLLPPYFAKLAGWKA